MIVRVIDMGTGNKFMVDAWHANTAEFALESVIKQLKAAAAIWPELEAVSVAIPKSLLSKKPEAK